MRKEQRSASRAWKPLKKELRQHLPLLVAAAALSIPVHVLAHKLFDLVLPEVPAYSWHSSLESLLFVLPALAVYCAMGYGASRLKRFGGLRPFLFGAALTVPTLAYSLFFSLVQTWGGLFEGADFFYPYLGIFTHLYLSSLAAFAGGVAGLRLGRWEDRRHAGASGTQSTEPGQLPEGDWMPFEAKVREHERAERPGD
jgi:hypothetical protein